MKKGDVVIIRYEGYQRRTGYARDASTYFRNCRHGLRQRCCPDHGWTFLRSYRGICIGHVSPEAAEGGVIGLVQTGDMIEIDLIDRRLNLEVSEEELERRRKEWKQPNKKIDGAFLRRYAHLVTSANPGAIFAMFHHLINKMVQTFSKCRLTEKKLVFIIYRIIIGKYFRMNMPRASEEDRQYLHAIQESGGC